MRLGVSSSSLRMNLIPICRSDWLNIEALKLLRAQTEEEHADAMKTRDRREQERERQSALDRLVLVLLQEPRIEILN
jgi:hypothetical protein